MLELIIFYIITTAGSLALTIYQELTMYKDVIEAGYIVDSKKLIEFNEQVKEEIRSSSLLSLFWPFVNLPLAASNLFKYYKTRSQVLNMLEVLDAVRKIPEETLSEYRKNPTLLNVFLIMMKDQSSISTIKINAKNGEQASVFRFQYDEGKKDINIIEAKGPAASLPYQEQKELILEKFVSIIESGIEEYGGAENFEKVLFQEKCVEIKDAEPIGTYTLKAQIKSIKLRRIDEENSYFEVELVDEDGKDIGTFGSPYITSAINFRKELFGILSVCDTYDLLKLGSKENISIPINFKCNERDSVTDIINSNNQVFHFKDGKYLTEEAPLDDCESFYGAITSIESISQTFSAIINSDNFTTLYTSNNLYYGFGYPLHTSTSNSNLSNRASIHYKEYIENILRFFGTDDLLRIGGEPQKLPEVIIKKDETGNIISLGSKDKDYHLNISENNYEITEGKLHIAENKSKKLI